MDLSARRRGLPLRGRLSDSEGLLFCYTASFPSLVRFPTRDRCSPAEIFDRTVDEGERRLDQSTLELVATSFIAGFAIVFGFVALGIVHALVEPQFGEGATIARDLRSGSGWCS